MSTKPVLTTIMLTLVIGLRTLSACSGREDALKRFAEQGVKLAACRNSMRDRSLTTEDLFPFVSTVDSGVAELVRKQEAGWAYVK